MSSKFLDGFMGFVVGDAMGIPEKDKSREELLAKPITKMVGYGTYNQPEGTWGFATSMLIATIDSINVKNKLDFSSIILNYVAYKNHANFTALNEVFGIGKTSSEAIERYEQEGLDPSLCGLKEAQDNEVLIRVLPIAYYAIETKLKEEYLFKNVKELSSLTHASDKCILGSYILVRFVMFLLNGKDKYSAYNMTKCVDYSMFDKETLQAYSRILNEDIAKLTINDIHSSKDIVDTLEAVIWVILKGKNFKEVIIGAINLGEETDIIGALTGAIAGILYGQDNIPEEWIENLARKEYLIDIFEEFSENKYE